MSYKQEKIIVIVSEFLNDNREYYPVTDISIEKARFFYKNDDGLFKIMSDSDYSIRTETNEIRLYITNEDIKNNSKKFQIGYEVNFGASEYETELPVLSVLVEMYNQLVEDTKTIFNYVKKQCFISDDKETNLILPPLPSYCVWCMGENGEMFAMPVSELYNKFQKMIDTLYAEIKALLDKDYSEMNKELLEKVEKIKKDLEKYKTDIITETNKLIEETIKYIAEQHHVGTLTENETVINIPEDFVLSERLRVWVNGLLLTKDNDYTLNVEGRTVTLKFSYKFDVDYHLTDNLPPTYIQELIDDFYNNAEQKKKDFNDNATEKTNAFNKNAETKTSEFNTNSENKTTEYNKNHENKLKAYNDNDTEKLKAYNDNDKTKTTAYNENHDAKLKAYNDNATQKIKDLDNHVETVNKKTLDDYTEEKTTEIKKSVDDYVEETTKPGIDSYVENTSKVDIKNYVETTNKKTINDYVENTSKAEIDAHTKTKVTEAEKAIDTAKDTAVKSFNDNASTKTSEFDKNVTAKTDEAKKNIGTYVTETTKPAIDGYIEETTKPGIDSYVDTTVKTNINNYVEETSKAEISTHTEKKITEAETAINTAKETAVKEFNTNAGEKTTSFDTNATNKTNDFNTNYDEKLKSFNNNSATKTTDFNNNVTEKTKEFDNYVKENQESLKGKNLEFHWDGTRLGVRIEGEAEYQYVELKGATGAVGANGKGLLFNWNGTQLGVKVEGEADYTYTDLKGATGAVGPNGADGVGIKDVTLKGQDASGGNIYTITLTNGATKEFTAPRGAVGPQGATGATGAVGPQGERGPAGANGKDGKNGTDATVTAGTGIEKSGTSISVKYGNTAGTACEGNDARLSDARKANGGNADTATKLKTARTINGVAFDGSANINVADSTKIPLSGNSTKSGNFTVTGEIVTNGNITAYSDKRLKYDVDDIKNPLEILRIARGYTYKMIGHKNRQAGVMADDLEKVFPLAVSADDNGIKKVNYTALIPVLINAVLELEKIVKGGSND